MGRLLIHLVQVLLQILILHTELLVKAVVIGVQVVPWITGAVITGLPVVPVSARCLIVLVVVVAELYGLE